MQEVSTKPYLMRALFEWCVENGYAPHIAVRVDAGTRVPAGYAKDGAITFNISPGAVHELKMGNELIEFSARFSGKAHAVSVPVANVQAIYARETGHGMTFELEEADPAATAPAESAEADAESPAPTRPDSSGGRPALRRVK